VIIVIFYQQKNNSQLIFFFTFTFGCTFRRLSSDIPGGTEARLTPKEFFLLPQKAGEPHLGRESKSLQQL